MTAGERTLKQPHLVDSRDPNLSLAGKLQLRA